VAETEIIADLRFMISDLSFGAENRGHKNGRQLVALSRQIAKPRRFDQMRFSEKFQPIAGFIAFTNRDFVRRHEAPSGRRPKRFSVIRAN
jgi:hypothetical protein